MEDRTKTDHTKRLRRYSHYEYIQNGYIPESVKERFKYKPYEHTKGDKTK